MHKVAVAHDTVLQATLAASFLLGVIPIGAEIKGVRVIAGAGTSITLREEDRLIKLYGGDIEQWEKKAGIVEAANFKYDVHWYERDGVQYEHKVKPNPKAK